MGYRARPRYEATIQRSDNTGRDTTSPGRQPASSMAREPIFSPAPRPEGPREPQVVLDALIEMHNEEPRPHA
jgi:hypothetical protein